MGVAADVSDVFQLDNRSIVVDDREFYVDDGAERGVDNRCDKNVLRISSNTGESKEDNGTYRRQERSRRHGDLPEGNCGENTVHNNTGQASLRGWNEKSVAENRRGC